MRGALLAIDQGTTGTTVVVLSAAGETLGRATRELPQLYPAPGWVEHDPEAIWDTVLRATAAAVVAAGIAPRELSAIGIANQRETTLLWDRKTGQPVHNAIVWQDRRTSEHCARLVRAGHQADVQRRTGLVIDPYFSATKIAWLLAAHPELERRAAAGELCFGTVDSFLVLRLCGGPEAGAPHVTDVTNASRTLLLDLESLTWDAELCELFEIPQTILPRIVPSAGVLGHTRGFPGLPDGIPIAGLAGDQHAALFGQGCFEPGDAKCTYGTGAFVLLNTGSQRLASRAGLLTTVAWQLGTEVCYALEGSSFVAGAAVSWLRDGLGVIESAGEVEALARQVEDSDGVAFVPALTGLGAPHWDPEARGLITGLTRRTTRAHLARATLEAIAFQVEDLMGAMRTDLGSPILRLRVDGGASANNLLMALQSGFSALTIERPSDVDSTARGAALLAGLGVGLFASTAELARLVAIDATFTPQLSETERAQHLRRWNRAVARTRSGFENRPR